MRIRILCLLTLGFPCFHAAAADEPFQPAAVHLGPIEFSPQLGLKEEYDSNFYHQAFNEQQFQVQILNLDLLAKTFAGPNQYSFDYQSEAGFVENSARDNYVDQQANLTGQWLLGARHRFELSGRYQQDHDRRGTGYFQGNQALLIGEPPRYQMNSILGRYSYGADGARGRLVFELEGADKTYLNLRELTRDNDHSEVKGDATFYWRMVGTLKALLETTQGRINYYHTPVTNPEGNRDSQFSRYLTGITWKIAGKTSGTFKLGYATKDFADRSRRDFAGASWSGQLNWSPQHTTTLSLTSGRQTDESYGRGDYIDATNWGVEWRQRWLERVASHVHYDRSRETYKGDPEGRDDDIARYGFDVDYYMRRWLALELFYVQELHQSNLASYDYQRDLAGLALRASL